MLQSIDCDRCHEMHSMSALQVSSPDSAHAACFTRTAPNYATFRMFLVGLSELAGPPGRFFMKH